MAGVGFQGWITRFISDSGAYPFMVPVLQHFVLPNATAIAFLFAYGELAIGIALTIGLCSRLASGFGLLHMLALLFSSNYPGPHVATPSVAQDLVDFSGRRSMCRHPARKERHGAHHSHDPNERHGVRGTNPVKESCY